MEKSENKKLNPRMEFWRRGACSNAMFHILNHEFKNSKLKEEKAADMLAGGIAQKGHQCGMLWGGALAIGTEAYRRFDDKNKAAAVAINATKKLVVSFEQRTHSVNCRDIAKVDWENKFQFRIYMLKTIARGFIFSPCFNLIVKWSPEAIRATSEGLSETVPIAQPCVNCASELVKKMGATDEESTMVAGFAGGIGLSGNACGALGAAVWYRMLEWAKNNPDTPPSMFNNPTAKNVIQAFYLKTDSRVLCKDICNRSFNTIDEHSEYIKSGGCKELISTMVHA